MNNINSNKIIINNISQENAIPTQTVDIERSSGDISLDFSQDSTDNKKTIEAINSQEDIENIREINNLFIELYEVCKDNPSIFDEDIDNPNEKAGIQE
jgi:hypothetical protein